MIRNHQLLDKYDAVITVLHHKISGLPLRPFSDGGQEGAFMARQDTLNERGNHFR